MTAPSWDPGGTYTPTFSDDFTGSSLDATKWTPGWQIAAAGPSGPINPASSTANAGVDGEAAGYSSSQVSVSGGYLNLGLVNTSITISSVTYPYTGSCVTTNPTTLGGSNGFEQALGCFEARINLPASGGLIANWPAFWTDGQTWPADGENDIMEGLGGNAQFHVNSTDNEPAVGAQAPGDSPSASNYTGWHTYGMSWNTSQIDFYYDGILVGSVATHIPAAAQYIVIDNTTGWQSGPEAAGTIQVDWVRVWAEPTAAVPLASVATLIDNFPSAADLYSKWTGLGLSVSSNRAAITCDPDYDGSMQSITQYALTGASFYAKVLNPAGTVETGMQLSDLAQAQNVSTGVSAGLIASVDFYYDGTDLNFSITQNQTTTTIASVAYSATAHAYWRIREASGTLYWDTSADGVTWANQASHTYTISLSALYANFWTGNDGTGTLATYVSDINGGTSGDIGSIGTVTLPALHPSGTAGPGPLPVTTTGSISLPAPAPHGTPSLAGGVVTATGSIGLPALGILQPPPSAPLPSTPGLAQPGHTRPGDAGLGVPVIYTSGAIGMPALGADAEQLPPRLLLAFTF